MRPSCAKILFWELLPLLALGALLILSYPTGETQTLTVAPEPLPIPVEITVVPPKTIEEPQTPIPPPAEARPRPSQKTATPTPPAVQSPRTLPPRQIAPTTLPPTALLPPQPHPTENPIVPTVGEQAITPILAEEATDEMTASAPATVYDSAQVDSAPHPQSPIRPAFPLRARRDGVSGSVLLEFIVDASGIPHEIHILSATPQGYFEQAALHAVATTRFSPASKNSRPVPCKVTLPLVFQVRE